MERANNLVSEHDRNSPEHGNADLSSLFRQEALDQKRDSWLGDILISRPASFAYLAWLFLIVSILILIYLAWGEYTKKARVTGYLVPEQGLIKIYVQQSGIITALRIKEGQSVRKGDVLAIVSTERNSLQGETQTEIAKQLELRKNSLLDEKTKTHRLYEQQIQSARKRLDQLHQELTTLAKSIQAQQQRVDFASVVVERYERLFAEHFVSELSLQEKRADLLDQKNRLLDLTRSKIVSERDAVSVATELQTLPLREQNELVGFNRTIGEIAGDSIENEARRETYVLAPQSGTVTAVQIDVGKQPNINQPIMSLIPAGTSLQADLYVPSRSVGFVRAGNFAMLQYQAFPYQKFGSHEGKVIRVSRTAVPAQELPFPASPQDVYYIVTIKPAQSYVTAYGRQEALQTGMQVDADIWLDRRTLLEWILEPLYSISGRV